MQDSLGNKIAQEYSVGQRIELHPATDAWMRGDRYGEIRKVGVKMACYVIDAYARSYYEGQTFEIRADAIAATKRIAEGDRPFGVWIATEEDDDDGEEIFAPTFSQPRLPAAVS